MLVVTARWGRSVQRSRGRGGMGGARGGVARTRGSVVRFGEARRSGRRRGVVLRDAAPTAGVEEGGNSGEVLAMHQGLKRGKKYIGRKRRARRC